MTSIEDSARIAPAPDTAPARPIALAWFATTLFLSALLIFAIQPMFTKMVLPKLGGSPSVWSVAMVVFQAALFLGYVYAHLLARALRPARAALFHLALLAVVALTLPLGVAKGFGIPPEQHVTLWLVGLFFASIGLPFVALAASAPLLQSWFVATGHRQAANPYVLYAASNLGSFVALIAYPFAIEPVFALQKQIALWSAGFYALAALVAGAAFFAGGRAEVTIEDDAATGMHPTTAQRLSWCLLAAVPSGLVIAVTAFISTDLAAAPFLWVLPLAIYLLTFVAVFRDRPWISHDVVQRLVLYCAAPLIVATSAADRSFYFVILAFNLLLFMLIALACHGEAYRTRPPRGRVTEFYLWISFGGALGGVFAGLIAPNVFNNIYEYPLLLFAGLLLLPAMFQFGWRFFLRDAAPGLIAAAALAAAAYAGKLPVSLLQALPQWGVALILVCLMLAALLSAKVPARCLGLVVLTFAASRLLQPTAGEQILTARSFFGVHQVVETANRKFRLLFHGTTIHGAIQVRDDAGNPLTGRPEPLTYYYRGGPISDAVEAVRAARGKLDHVALVGLGTGSLACYEKPGEQWTFFEIDPEVIRIASDPKLFRFLSDCGSLTQVALRGAPVKLAGGSTQIVLGDARLTLAAQQEHYDLIVLDAFSSDAIPVHLLTREAFAGYLSRLAPHGVIVVHVSNRHMELPSVVAAVGQIDGLVVYGRDDDRAKDPTVTFRAAARVVVLAKDVADLGSLPSREGWERREGHGTAAWTDDYANVLGAIIRQKFPR